MSPINLDDLINEHPAYRGALLKLGDWLRTHNDVRIIYPSALAREVRGVDPLELSAVLNLLANVGLLRRVYKVLTPDGVLTDEEFDDPTKIPEKLPDRWEHYFDTAESDVVPVFKKVA